MATGVVYRRGSATAFTSARHSRRSSRGSDSTCSDSPSCCSSTSLSKNAQVMRPEPPVPRWSTKTRSRARRTSESSGSIGPASSVAAWPGRRRERRADPAPGCRRRPGSRRSSGSIVLPSRTWRSSWTVSEPQRGRDRDAVQAAVFEIRPRLSVPRTAQPPSRPARPLRPAPTCARSSSLVSPVASRRAWSREYTHGRRLRFGRVSSPRTRRRIPLPSTSRPR